LQPLAVIVGGIRQEISEDDTLYGGRNIDVDNCVLGVDNCVLGVDSGLLQANERLFVDTNKFRPG